VRRAGLIVDQRQLAEVLAHTQNAQDDFASVFADEDDFDATLTDDEQGVTGIVLEDNHAPLGIRFLTGELGEANQLGFFELGEEWNGPEEVGCFHARKIVQELALGSGSATPYGQSRPPLMTPPS
jgi:hypothetical protein